MLYLSINVGYPDAYMQVTDYSLSFEQGKALKGTDADTLRNTGKYLHLKLFPNKDLNLKDDSLFELKGKFILDDGVQLSINASGSTKFKTNGCAQSTGMEGDVPPVIPLPKVELYGVSNIGIGIYRKVEQEICCYVPGEVSRIENIMAREYKERQTRSLTSSETTEETTSEVEIENTTDTTTTERNEMQTEIGHVLDEDKSFSAGGSLGVSTHVFGADVNANGYIDYSSSTSSSISDSAAKTYAQDVTDRALERVVQKTTIKRTSQDATGIRGK